MKVGAFDIDILVDAEGSFATMSEAFPAIESDEPWTLPINCVLVRAAEAIVLVDTGAGPQPRTFMADAVTRLPKELARSGVQPEQVDIVVHTHLHVDHVGWDGAFSKARYVIPRDDWAFFMSDESLEQRPHLPRRQSRSLTRASPISSTARPKFRREYGSCRRPDTRRDT